MKGRDFCLHQDRLWGPPSLLANGYLGTSSPAKRPGREGAHSLSARAEVKKTWIYTFAPPWRNADFISICLISLKLSLPSKGFG
jgi:hypothetical protein